MSYTYITIEEHACIKKMKSEGSSIRAIARYLERSPSTISREIKRNKGKNGVYY
ncbi:MAG: helix-turn-helix domain-containing protein, partial [Erysipelothrix sp.]|nr:helix-turn-helix domain-containing protein [Erysipelothrix sp.]